MKTNPQWITFSLDGKEIAAISISGLSPDEIGETTELLAYEKGVSPDQIKIGSK